MSLDEITLVHVRMGVLGPIVAVGVLVLHVVVIVARVRMGVRVPIVVMWVDVSVDMGVRCTHALFPFVSRCVEVAPNGRTSASSR